MGKQALGSGVFEDGSATLPSIAFNTAPATGFYKLSDGTGVGLAVAGTNVLSVTGSSATFTGSIVRSGQKRIINVGAKVGTTAGWVVKAANNLGILATLPAAQTASTLVIPVSGLKVGDTITSFHAVGQIESGGNTCTFDADLRKLTAVAADITDASIGAITQLSVVADTVISSANSSKTLDTPEVIAEGETFYVLIAGTTAAATDIALQGIAIVVTES